MALLVSDVSSAPDVVTSFCSATPVFTDVELLTSVVSAVVSLVLVLVTSVVRDVVSAPDIVACVVSDVGAVLSVTPVTPDSAVVVVSALFVPSYMQNRS